jgi:hypothetical protein
MREQRVVLKHGIHIAPVGRNAVGPFAKNFDPPLGWLVESGDKPKAGRLAGTGRAEHREEFAGRDLERHSINRAHGAEVARYVLE